jgi:hypothetical protein
MAIANNPGTSYEALVCAGFTATTGAFSSTLSAGTTTITGTLAATKNANSDQSFTLTNTTAGTAANARIDLVGDASGGQLTIAQYNTSYTGTFAGVNLAKLKLILDNSAAGNSNGLMLASPNSIYIAPGNSVVGTFASTGLSITGTLSVTGTITGTASGNAVAGATCTYTGTLVESAGIAYTGATSSGAGSQGGIATGTLDIGSNRAMTGIRSVASTNVACCGFTAGAIYIRGFNLKNN